VVLENPFECKNASVRTALQQELGIPSGWDPIATFRLTPHGPEYYDATREVWVRLGYNAGHPVYTDLPADFPDDANFRITTSGLEFYDAANSVWVRMTFDNLQPVFTTL